MRLSLVTSSTHLWMACIQRLSLAYRANCKLSFLTNNARLVIWLLMETIDLLGSSPSSALDKSSLVDDVGSYHGNWLLCIATVLLVCCAIISNINIGLTIAASILVVEEQSLRTSC